MGYKEIMSQVDKQKAVQFMLKLKSLQTNEYRYTYDWVRQALASIGINELINDNTANAIITRMERKSKINF